MFRPYDADDILKIVKLRVEKALDGRKVDEAALRKIAAYASRETGDARKAVALLAKAVRIAEEGSGRLTEKEVDAAEERLDIDKTAELVMSLAPQQRLALRACYEALRREKRRLSTGDVYQTYCRLCDAEGFSPLTQRRFPFIVNFLDIHGLVSARVSPMGRYGLTRVITASLPADVVRKFLRGEWDRSVC